MPSTANLQVSIDVRDRSTASALVSSTQLHMFPWTGSISFWGEAEWGSPEFHKTLVGQSVGECLQQLGMGVEAVVRPAPELSVSEPKIIDIDAGRAYINVGSAEGVRNGDKFGVWDLGRELRDPQTDTVLGYAVPRRVGVIQVEQVLNDHLSQVNILEGQEEIEPAFTIRAE